MVSKELESKDVWSVLWTGQARVLSVFKHDCTAVFFPLMLTFREASSDGDVLGKCSLQEESTELLCVVRLPSS